MNASSMVRNQAAQAPTRKTAASAADTTISGARRAAGTGAFWVGSTSVSIAVMESPRVAVPTRHCNRGASDQRTPGPQPPAQVPEAEVVREAPQRAGQHARHPADRREERLEPALVRGRPGQAHLV